jgi:ubiquinone/menaquinone biosynthesis C-methylase UbiE
MPDPAPAPPRLYNDLSGLWPFVSPPEHYVEEVATFRRRFERHGIGAGARVLHLGSGGGSIDHHLKQHYRVTGVDISAAMLAHSAGINPEVEYIQGDIRTVRLGRTFDVVLVHDAISYMTSVADLERVYRTAAAHLEPGGLMLALPEELRSRLAPDQPDVETHRSGNRIVTIIEFDYDDDPADHEFETVFVFIIRENGEVRVEVDRHPGGVYDLDDFLGAITRAGFEAVAEPWELSDWTPGREMPLITAVRRPAVR